MPLSVETPAPVSTTHGCRSRMSSASARPHGRIVVLPRGRLLVLDRRACAVRGDGRAGHRAPCVVPRLARGRARRLPRAPCGRLPGDPRTRSRGAHDRGLASLSPSRVLRRDAHACGLAAATCAAPASVRVPRRTRTGSSSPTAIEARRRRRETAIARRACPPGSSRRSLRPRRRRRSRRRRSVGVSSAGGVGLLRLRGLAFVPTRTTRVSPSYDVVHVSVVHQLAVGGVDLARRARRVGAARPPRRRSCPSGSFGSSTRSTGPAR